MIREERFRISRRPYAVDLSSLESTRRETHRGPYWRVDLQALWFRRKDGRTQAVLGSLSGHVDVEPVDAVQVLHQLTDGRYGGSWVARWDGEHYASMVPHSPGDIEANMALLRPALENHPEVPAGFDGWWTYGTTEEQYAAARALREARG